VWGGSDVVRDQGGGGGHGGGSDAGEVHTTILMNVEIHVLVEWGFVMIFQHS